MPKSFTKGTTSIIEEDVHSVKGLRWIAQLVWKWINLVCRGFTSRPWDKDQVVVLSNSSWRWSSSLLLKKCKRVMSSANLKRRLFLYFSFMPSMTKAKRNGDITLPWGTPLITLCQSEVFFEHRKWPGIHYLRIGFMTFYSSFPIVYTHLRCTSLLHLLFRKTISIAIVNIFSNGK